MTIENLHTNRPQVHISLHEHNYLEPKNVLVAEHILNETDRDTKHVVFFMENAIPTDSFLKGLEDSNSGRSTYYDAIAKSVYLLPDDNAVAKYPLIRNLAPDKYAEQLLKLGTLMDCANDGYGFNWDLFRTKQQTDMQFHSYAFFIARARELDRARDMLAQKGIKFDVITENPKDVMNISPEFIQRVVQYQETLGRLENSNNINEIVSVLANVAVDVTLLGLVRDELSAEFLLEKMKDYQGKVEVFSHFGSLHKYLPERLRKYGFRVTSDEDDLLSHQQGLYEIIYDCVQKIGSAKKLLEVPNVREQIREQFLQEFKLELYIEAYVNKVAQQESPSLDTSKRKRRFLELQEIYKTMPAPDALKDIDEKFRAL